MRAFSELLDRLSLTASRNAKLVLVRDYLRAAPDPDRGWALAALTGDLKFNDAKPAMIRRAVEARVDPVLFGWSYDYVGDLAEAAALIWPPDPDYRPNREPELSEVIDTLKDAKRSEIPGLIERWMDALDPRGRWALLKLMTGSLRVGLSAQLARTALATIRPDDMEPISTAEVVEVWHDQVAPYAELFAWLEGRGERPGEAPGRFRPVMLAHPLDEAEINKLDPEAFAAEWKWDGIRAQVVREGGVRRIYSRTDDEISKSFPDLDDAFDFDGVIDGELLVVRDGIVAPFADLQQRLNRKTVDAKTVAAHPVAVVAYDLLSEAGEDLRALPLSERRGRLEAFVARVGSDRLTLSPLVPYQTWDELAALRTDPPVGAAAEGLMLKRWDSAYVAGRPKGPWFKWKRDPHNIDAVLMYAQRGHGKRSSFYSDFTFGVWTDQGELTPVGKAYFGFTDEELKQLDKFVRDNTLERFGPVRSVKATREHGLVLEIAFEGLQRSSRHKSGVAMRFPRISRIRWDKPTREANRLDDVMDLLDAIEQAGGRVTAGPGAV